MNKVNILAVDDDAINIKLIQAYLKNADFLQNLYIANNGLEAYNIVKDASKDVNIVLLDLSMPIMTGYEFMDKFFKEFKDSKIQIIILTTDAQAKNVVLRHDVSDFLQKPVHKDDLITKVHEAINVINKK